MDDVVAVVGQHPLRVLESFDAVGEFALLGELFPDFVANGLNLARVAAGADDKVVGKGGNPLQIQHDDRGGFFRFRSTDGGEPGWGGFRDFGRQVFSLPTSYNGCAGQPAGIMK